MSPTNVRLTDASPSAPLTITNTGSVPLRIQANGFVWQQALDGSLVLTPSDKLLLFPVVLTIEPGELRLVRIGSTDKSEATERSYRVVIAAFPLDPADAGGGKSLSMRARVSVPVFIAPLKATYAGDVIEPAVHKNALVFAVANKGTVHFTVRKAHVTILGSNGATLASGDVDGWYVLAGDRRPLSFPLATGICAKASSATIELTGPPFPTKKTFDHLTKQCAAA